MRNNKSSGRTDFCHNFPPQTFPGSFRRGLFAARWSTKISETSTSYNKTLASKMLWCGETSDFWVKLMEAGFKSKHIPKHDVEIYTTCTYGIILGGSINPMPKLVTMFGWFWVAEAKRKQHEKRSCRPFQGWSYPRPSIGLVFLPTFGWFYIYLHLVDFDIF